MDYKPTEAVILEDPVRFRFTCLCMLRNKHCTLFFFFFNWTIASLNKYIFHLIFKDFYKNCKVSDMYCPYHLLYILTLSKCVLLFQHFRNYIQVTGQLLQTLHSLSTITVKLLKFQKPREYSSFSHLFGAIIKSTEALTEPGTLF